MTENELRNITPRAYAIKLVSSQATDEIMSSARPTVTHVAVEGDSATIQLEATINSAKQQMVIPMVVEDGEWKVTSLPINPVRIRFGL
jgi:hypothetical protein